MIRSDQCSRAHAQLEWSPHGWSIRDLGSRNGTNVNGASIDGEYLLQVDDVIQIAGCQLTYVDEVSDAMTSDAPPPSSADGQPTQQQIDPSFIADRRSHSALLDPADLRPSNEQQISLLPAVFALSRSHSPEEAAEIALKTLNELSGTHSGAVLVSVKSKSNAGAGSLGGMTALATTSRSERSYRRLSDQLAQTVLQSGEAVLARNIQDDLSLATPDSQGEFSTTSALCAPIRIGERCVGLVHIYAADDEPELTPLHLEYALALAENLALVLEHHWRERQLTHHLKRSEKQLAQLREQLGDRVQIVGQSPAILEIERQVSRAAPTSATVLVRGESGVGKELIAAAIHYASPRKNGPFVCLNCAALSPSLLESELFGHEKGAFTGATERKIGKFEAADGGTLMLDEIGEMNPEIQAKFLRVLEGQPFERVGGNQAIRVDVRVVAATNRNLEEAVKEGSFRSDLFFRLHVLELRVPPLRERGNDVVQLAEHFIERYCREMGRRLEGLTPEAQKKLLSYRWPGNIRELKNTIERAVVLCSGPLIDATDLLLSDLQLPGGDSGSANSDSPDSANPMTSALTAAVCDDRGEPFPLARIEQEHIERVLRHTDGNKSQAARILGIERSTLDRKLKRLQK